MKKFTTLKAIIKLINIQVQVATDLVHTVIVQRCTRFRCDKSLFTRTKVVKPKRGGDNYDD